MGVAGVTASQLEDHGDDRTKEDLIRSVADRFGIALDDRDLQYERSYDESSQRIGGLNKPGWKKLERVTGQYVDGSRDGDPY
jgi:hypothetical protein